MATGNCLVPNILQNVFFCAQQKKETHTGLEQLGDKWTIPLLPHKQAKFFKILLEPLFEAKETP